MGWDGALRRPESCLSKRVLSWWRKQDMVELFRISKGMEFQMMGAPTEKLRDLKPVRTHGTNNKLEPEERKV